MDPNEKTRILVPVTSGEKATDAAVVPGKIYGDNSEEQHQQYEQHELIVDISSSLHNCARGRPMMLQQGENWLRLEQQLPPLLEQSSGTSSNANASTNESSAPNQGNGNGWLVPSMYTACTDVHNLPSVDCYVCIDVDAQFASIKDMRPRRESQAHINGCSRADSDNITNSTNIYLARRKPKKDAMDGVPVLPEHHQQPKLQDNRNGGENGNLLNRKGLSNEYTSFELLLQRQLKILRQGDRIMLMRQEQRQQILSSNDTIQSSKNSKHTSSCSSNEESSSEPIHLVLEYRRCDPTIRYTGTLKHSIASQEVQGTTAREQDQNGTITSTTTAVVKNITQPHRPSMHDLGSTHKSGLAPLSASTSASIITGIEPSSAKTKTANTTTEETNSNSFERAPSHGKEDNPEQEMEGYCSSDSETTEGAGEVTQRFTMPIPVHLSTQQSVDEEMILNDEMTVGSAHLDNHEGKHKDNDDDDTYDDDITTMNEPTQLDPYDEPTQILVVPKVRLNELTNEYVPTQKASESAQNSHSVCEEADDNDSVSIGSDQSAELLDGNEQDDVHRSYTYGTPPCPPSQNHDTYQELVDTTDHIASPSAAQHQFDYGAEDGTVTHGAEAAIETENNEQAMGPLNNNNHVLEASSSAIITGPIDTADKTNLAPPHIEIRPSHLKQLSHRTLKVIGLTKQERDYNWTETTPFSESDSVSDTASLAKTSKGEKECSYSSAESGTVIPSEKQVGGPSTTLNQSVPGPVSSPALSDDKNVMEITSITEKEFESPDSTHVLETSDASILIEESSSRVGIGTKLQRGIARQEPSTHTHGSNEKVEILKSPVVDTGDEPLEDNAEHESLTPLNGSFPNHPHLFQSESAVGTEMLNSDAVGFSLQSTRTGDKVQGKNSLESRVAAGAQTQTTVREEPSLQLLAEPTQIAISLELALDTQITNNKLVESSPQSSGAQEETNNKEQLSTLGSVTLEREHPRSSNGNKRSRTSVTPLSPPSTRKRIRGSSQKAAEGSRLKERTVHDHRIRVMITGVPSIPRHKQMVEKIGGLLLESIEEAVSATHVIAGDFKTSLRRTPKLMIGMCRTSNILYMDWLTKSARARNILDCNDYLLVNDNTAENKFKFSMKQTLENGDRIRQRGEYLLDGWFVHVCKGVAGNKAPPENELRLMVEAANGDWLTSLSASKIKKIDASRILVITNDPVAQKELFARDTTKALKLGAHPFTTAWLFHCIIKQELFGFDN